MQAFCLAALALVPFAAGCVPDTTRSLADLDLETEIDADPGRLIAPDVPAYPWDLSLVLDTGRIDDDADCPTVDDGITATLDGEPMVVAMRNGTVFIPEFSPAGECLPISFLHVPRTRSTTRARGEQPAHSTIVITERDKTWQIVVPDLLTNDLAPVGPLARGTTDAFVWPSAAAIASVEARVGPEVMPYTYADGKHWQWYGGVGNLTVTGDRIEIPIGPLDEVAPSTPFAVWADRTPTPERCDPPLRCEVYVFDAFAGTL